MKSLPKVALTPRARKDIRNLLSYIGRQKRGKLLDRKAELNAAFEMIQRAPTSRPVRRWATATHLGLRCRYTRSFAVIYALLNNVGIGDDSIVSIRAVRHCRARDVFFGVRESGTDMACLPLNTRSTPSSATCAEWPDPYQT